MSGLLYLIWNKPKLPKQLRHIPLQFASYKISTNKQKDTTMHMSLLQTRIDTFLLHHDDYCWGFSGVWTCLSSSTHDLKFSYPYRIFKVWDLSFSLNNPLFQVNVLVISFEGVYTEFPLLLGSPTNHHIHALSNATQPSRNPSSRSDAFNLASLLLTITGFPSLLEPSDPYGFSLCRAKRNLSRLTAFLVYLTNIFDVATLNLLCTPHWVPVSRLLLFELRRTNN